MLEGQYKCSPCCSCPEILHAAPLRCALKKSENICTGLNSPLPPNSVLSSSAAIEMATRNLLEHIRASHHILTWDQPSVELGSHHSFSEHIDFPDSEKSSVSPSRLWGYWFHSGQGKSLFVRCRESNVPAPQWGACGLQHQCDALRSMLSFMRSSVSSLSVVLGLLPPVSSPPESDASARTILSPLFRYCTLFTLFSLSLWRWSTRPYGPQHLMSEHVRFVISFSREHWRERVEMTG